MFFFAHAGGIKGSQGSQGGRSGLGRGVDAVAAHEREQFVLAEDDDAAAGAKDTRRELLVGLGLGWGLLAALGLELAEKTPVLIKGLPGCVLRQA
jgi:hypothetical protein